MTTNDIWLARPSKPWVTGSNPVGRAILLVHDDAVIVRKSVVAVAQLVESRIVIPVVVGSSPISHPIIIRLALSE